MTYLRLGCSIFQSIFMRFSLFISFIVPFLFISCTDKRVEKDLKRIMGQQITLSSDWSTIFEGKDTVLTSFTDVPIKLVIWYDSFSCGACEASKMSMWRNMVAYADSLAQWFSIIYLFSPRKIDLYRVIMTLKAEEFNYPVFIDQTADFVKQNPNLPPNPQLHSFLLDKNNRVVLVGNPLYNPSLWALYKRTIQTMIANDGLLPVPEKK